MKHWLLALLLLLPTASFAQDAGALRFHTLHDDEPVTLEELHGDKATLILWRADCAPCRHETKLLPAIAEANSRMTFVIVSLQDAKTTEKALAETKLPDNVKVWIADDSASQLFSVFSDTHHALPFSVALDKHGEICVRHHGILGANMIKRWEVQC